MKYYLCFILALIFTANLEAQKQNKQTVTGTIKGTVTGTGKVTGTFNGAVKKKVKQIETTVFTIDLSKPNANSVNNGSKKNKLVFPNKNPIQVELINGNPFKYKYVLNYNLVNLFFDENFIPFSNTGIEIDKNEVSEDAKVTLDAITDETVIDPS